MSGSWEPYIVRDCESVSELAYRRGTTTQEVWNHAKNTKLKGERDNPEVLAPGDLLWLPAAGKPTQLELATGANNRFQIEVPKASVTVHLRDSDDQPMSGVDYVVDDGAGEGKPGTTDGNGKVTIQVPVLARQVRIVLSETHVVIPVLVGGISPLATSSGAFSRLCNLGYYQMGTRSDQEEANHRQIALMTFQEDYELTITGELDETTVAKLGKLVGTDGAA